MKRRKKLKFLLSLLVTLLLIFAAIWMTLNRPPSSPPETSRAGILVRSKSRRPLNATIIFERIRSCGELVTVHVQCGPWEEKIMQTTDIRFWPDAQEVCSALVCGRISYGIDLSDTRPADVNVADEGRKIVIRLPPVRKLGARLDLDRTRILGHKKSWHWGRDSSLREAVLEQAERRLKETEAEGAKRMAKKKAEEVVESLLRQLLDPDVEVEFVEEEGER